MISKTLVSNFAFGFSFGNFYFPSLGIGNVRRKKSSRLMGDDEGALFVYAPPPSKVGLPREAL
jgi:hypothetical protein